MKAPKTWKQIKADPRVESVSDERHLGSGLWVYLKPGWADQNFDPGWQDCSMIHEDTVKEICTRLGGVVQLEEARES